MLRNHELSNFMTDIRGEKLMMELSTMSLSRTLSTIFALSLSASSWAAVQHRYVCPAFVSDGKARRALENVTVYDGAPEERASLIPMTTNNVDTWDMHETDAYLSCEYKGTDKVVTIHALGASYCRAAGYPLVASCN
ncbi:STY0301 family protein [Rhodanobacter sp. MP7CTX1]|uniref:STY0301 family protein n=1 Tax=Rhodanobacter sp. MP7CTX1 TaxID=2723084 RepID=UPI001622DD43|nr:STY0301 family protein [Rhodanobacter sp. MP7CTX1]